MSSVLVVQPDAAQAETLRDIAQRIGTDLVIVNSTSAAIDSISRKIPDLILLSTLLSPRDEDALISHLRSLEGASHLQTLTIPQFRGAGGKKAEKSRGGLFGRKKTKAPVEVGCDPAVFAEEVLMQLRIAEDVRSRPVVPKSVVVPIAEPPLEAPAEPAWTPQAWPEPGAQAEPESASHVDALFNTPIGSDEAANATEIPVYVPDLPAIDPSPEARSAKAEDIPADEDEIDRIARELGLNLKILDETDATPPAKAGSDGDSFDFGAALDRARLEADRRSLDLARKESEAAEAIREAAIAAARAAAEREAREALAADLARVQAEAEAMREAAIAEARAAAEREAREKLDAELARVRAETEVTVAGALSAERQAREKLDAELAKMRAETEVTVADALSRVKQEAADAERLRAEADRARKDAERARAEAAEVAERLRTEAAAEGERARAEAERLRLQAQEAFASDLARVKAEVEQTLAAQLDAARTESERMRAAEAKAARDRAAVETQLKAEIDRLKFVAAQTKKSDESETRRASDQIRHLESELAKVHDLAEKRQAVQLEELRAQMAEMREAAAQHARAAAAEAVKSEVARATSSPDLAPRKLNVVRMPSRAGQPELLPIAASVAPAKKPAPVKPAPLPRLAEEPAASDQSGRDYYSLWKPEPESAAPPPPVEPPEERRIDFRRHMKWALLPVAACLLLVTNTGSAISTVARFVTPAEKPVMTVQPLDVEKPFIEVVEERVGQLKLESTPAGAEAIIDGKSYGQTPLSIPMIAAGSHTLVLKSSAGAITKQFTVKPNQTTMLSEAIFSGWLAIFAPFPVNVLIDGQPVSLTDDGRVMTTPGKHVVELVAERFDYRSSETLNVKPGETTAHTLVAPMGTVRIATTPGVEIRIDGELATGSPSEGLSVPIGPHDITATHPVLGERRVSVDVRHGSLTEVSLSFE
jgi:CheY-like chemotaxis protein